MFILVPSWFFKHLWKNIIIAQWNLFFFSRRSERYYISYLSLAQSCNLLTSAGSWPGRLLWCMASRKAKSGLPSLVWGPTTDHKVQLAKFTIRIQLQQGLVLMLCFLEFLWFFISVLYCTAAIWSNTSILQPHFASMGPDELEVFFKRMFALKVPKDPWLDLHITCRYHIKFISYNFLSYGLDYLQVMNFFHLDTQTFISWLVLNRISKSLVGLKSKVIIFLVLLVSWMEDENNVKSNFQVIEYFAGVGRIAQVAHRKGYQSVAFDLTYGEERAARVGKRSPMDINSNAGFVLAIKMILRSEFNSAVGIFAVLCSSFVPVNRGTGSRDIMIPEGNENVVSVRKSNKLLSRLLGSWSYLYFIFFQNTPFLSQLSNLWSPRNRRAARPGRWYWCCWWSVPGGLSLWRTRPTRLLQCNLGLFGWWSYWSLMVFQWLG